MATWQTHFDEIRIRMPGPSLLTTVSLVTLILVDLEEVLPPTDPTDGVRYATLDGETRRGWILGRDSIMRATVEVRPWNLQFRAGPLAALHQPGMQPTLRLSASHKAGSYGAQEWELAGFKRQTPGWETLVANTEDWDRLPVNLELELSQEGPGQGVVMLTEPGLYPQGESEQVVLLITSEGMGQPWGSEPEEKDLPTSIRPWLKRGKSLPSVLPASDGHRAQLAAWMTGLSPRDTGVWSDDHKLDLKAATLAEQFHAAGFRTLASVFSPELAHEQSGLGQGFDRYYAPVDSPQSAGQAVRIMADWLDEVPGCKSFLWLHLPGPVTGGPGNPPWGTDLEAFLDAPALDGALILFSATCGQEGQSQNAVLGSQRIPMVFQGDIQISPPKDPRIASTCLGKTLLEWAGITSEEFPGTSLISAPIPGLDTEPHFLVGERAERLAVQSGEWLFAVRLQAGAGAERHTPELYNVGQDPTCQNNLATNPQDAGQARRMRLALSRWTQNYQDLDWVDPTRVYGYAKAWAQPQVFQPKAAPQADWLPERCGCGQCPQGL